MKSHKQDTRSESSTGNSTLIFIDDCFDSRSKIGVGSMLVVETECIEKLKATDLQSLDIETEDFDETSSARLELQTLIWALHSLDIKRGSPLILYPKSKTALSFLERRPKFEKNNFMSLSPGIPLANADLLQDFFKLHDRYGFEVVWLEGKDSQSNDDRLQLVLTEVVKCADKKLKDRLKSQNQVASRWF